MLYHRLFLLASLLTLVAGFMPASARAQTEAPVSEYASGHIVLNVEGVGEAWYVSPMDGLRYELGRPQQAFEVMRTFALGIADVHLDQLPRAEDGFVGNRILRERLAGRMLLQVQGRGEVWYVHPVTTKRHYLGRPEAAFAVMRELGLGISRTDLAQITIGVVGANNIDGVPFYAQAPRGNWGDLRQQEGCEEASVLMARDWVSGQMRSLAQAEAEIIAVSEYEREHWGYFVDTSAEDTYDRLVKGYYGLEQSELVRHVNAIDVLQALSEGKVVLVTVDGHALGNPYFQGSGPVRHMILVHGYDYVTGSFITHEPGTTRGENYRYSYETMELAMNDYASGVYAPLPTPPRTAMITISRP